MCGPWYATFWNDVYPCTWCSCFHFNACFNYILIYGAFGFLRWEEQMRLGTSGPTGSCWLLRFWFVQASQGSTFQLWSAAASMIGMILLRQISAERSIATWPNGKELQPLSCRSYHFLPVAMAGLLTGKFHHHRVSPPTMCRLKHEFDSFYPDVFAVCLSVSIFSSSVPWRLLYLTNWEQDPRRMVNNIAFGTTELLWFAIVTSTGPYVFFSGKKSK